MEQQPENTSTSTPTSMQAAEWDAIGMAIIAEIGDHGENSARRTLIIGPNNQFSVLAMWNLPPQYRWDDVVQWVLSLLPIIGSPKLECILRTNETGSQVFWLKFKEKSAAMTFRGLVTERRISTGGPIIHCPFVLPSDYAGANGRSSDFWTPQHGLSHNRPLDSAPFSNHFCRHSITSPELRIRLGMGPPPTSYTKPSKSHRRRMNRANNHRNSERV